MADPAWRHKPGHLVLQWRGWLIPPMLLILAILPRLSAFGQGFITTDELAWLYRSAHFRHALETRQWANTLPDDGPGVTTMWIGTLSILYARQQNPTVTAAHLAWIAPVSQFDPQNVALATHLTFFLPIARAILAVVHALGVVGIYFFVRRLWNKPTALLAGLLIALDPFTVAFSGLLNAESPMATLAILSLLAWLNALKLPADTHTWRATLSSLGLGLLSGLCAGAAILSHLLALFLIPAMFISTIVWLVFSKNRPFKIVLLSGILWIIGLLGVVWGAFPAMWIDSRGTAAGMYALLIRHLQATQVAMPDGSSPSSWSYLTACLLRLTPITLIGLALSVGAPLLAPGSDARQRRLGYGVWWLWIAGFILLLGVDRSPVEQHALPLFFLLNVPAAIGWSETACRLFSLRRQTIPLSIRTGIILFVLLTQGAAILGGWPYYLDVYNPLIGGLKTATRTLPVGRGEGLEQIAAYLNRLPNPEAVVVAAAQPAALAPLFKGQTLPLDGYAHLLADYMVVTVHDRQTDAAAVEAMVGNAQVMHTVRAGGVPIVWLYRPVYTAEAAHLAQFAAPTDLILCDAPTPFARHAADGLPTIRMIADADEGDIVAMLNRWRAQHTRLWYIASPAASPITAQAIRRQLDTYAVRLDIVELDYATITLYILPGEADFRPFDTPVSVWTWSALDLTGVALLRPTPPADGQIEFVSRWRANARPQADVSPVFYLTDEAGHLWASSERLQPLLNTYGYPTSVWQAGESCELLSTLSLPPGLPPGRYQIYVGLAAPGYQDTTSAQIAQVEIAPAQTPPSPDMLDFPNHLSITWRGQLKLFGHDLLSGQAVPAEHTFSISLGWTATDRPGERYNVRFGLEGTDGYTAVMPVMPLSHFPTDQWRRGETLRQIYDLTLPADLPGGRYTLTIQVLNVADIPLSPPVPLGEITVTAK